METQMIYVTKIISQDCTTIVLFNLHPWSVVLAVDTGDALTNQHIILGIFLKIQK